MPTLHYRVVDVFTDRPFAGNPLAVVLDADDLDTDDLARIARQFNLSETAFPMQPTQEQRSAGADYGLRIFTPIGEIPFAGHPSVGSAWVLARLGRVTPGTVHQATESGVQALQVGSDGGPVELTGGVPQVLHLLDPVAALTAASLSPGTELNGLVRVATCGLDFGFLPLADERDIARSAPDPVAVRALEAAGGIRGLEVFCWDAETRTAHARMFCTMVSFGEDPATGSAALALGAHLVADGLLPGDGEATYTVRQGAEIGRPSRLECTVVAEGGVAVQCRVAGSVAPVASGEIRRPAVRR